MSRITCLKKFEYLIPNLRDSKSISSKKKNLLSINLRIISTKQFKHDRLSSMFDKQTRMIMNPRDLSNLSRRVIIRIFRGPGSRLIDRLLFRGEFSRMLMTRSYFHAAFLLSGGQFRGSLRHSFISRPPPPPPPRFGRVPRS